jgi:hypothetical protein
VDTPTRPIPRSEISIGVDPGLRPRLWALAAGRVLVIDYFASRRCGVTIGDLTAGLRHRRPGAGYVELAPIEGIPVFAETRLLATLREGSPWLHLGGPVFAQHLAVRLDRPELWIDFLDEPSTIARRPSATRPSDETTGAGR